MVINSELITFRGSHPGLPSWPGLGGARWFLGCNEVLDFGVEFFFSKQNSRGHVVHMAISAQTLPFLFNVIIHVYCHPVCAQSLYDIEQACMY